MRESDLLMTDRIGQHEVLLPINRNRYNFRKKKETFSISISGRDNV